MMVDYEGLFWVAQIDHSTVPRRRPYGLPPLIDVVLGIAWIVRFRMAIFVLAKDIAEG